MWLACIGVYKTGRRTRPTKYVPAVIQLSQADIDCESNGARRFTTTSIRRGGVFNADLVTSFTSLQLLQSLAAV